MKILHILPHLSTGGLPQYALNVVRSFDRLKMYDQEVVEFSFISNKNIVQRTKMIDLLHSKGKQLITLNDGSPKKEQLANTIKAVKPDLVYIHELPELFMTYEEACTIYFTNRPYRVFEGTHTSNFAASQKFTRPDLCIVVSDYQIEMLRPLNLKFKKIELDIIDQSAYSLSESLRAADLKSSLGFDEKDFVFLSVGLWTPRKNQKEVVEIANRFIDSPNIRFVIVGGLADNFKDYWQPIVDDLPPNCTVYGESDRVDDFYRMADALLFLSDNKGGDKETSPLVIREAISCGLPVFLRDHAVYMAQYDKFELVDYLPLQTEPTIEKLSGILKEKGYSIKMEARKAMFHEGNLKLAYDASENKIYFSLKVGRMHCKISIRDKDNHQAIYCFETTLSEAPNWCIPIPKFWLDYYDYNKKFRAYAIDVYSLPDMKLIEREEIQVYPDRRPNPTLLPHDPWNLTWINYQEIFEGKIYNVYNINVEGKICMDIGANDGLFTHYLLKNKFAKRIIAIECDSRAVKNLNKLSQKYGNDVISVVDAAIWKEDQEQMQLGIQSDTSTVSSIAPDKVSQAEKTITVRALTLETILTELGNPEIDFVKMDIEGVETDVIDSLSDAQIQSIAQWLVEVHWNTDGRLERFCRRFKSLGYEVEVRAHIKDNQLVDESNYNNADLVEMCTLYASKFGSDDKKGGVGSDFPPEKKYMGDEKRGSSPIFSPTPKVYKANLVHISTNRATKQEIESGNNVRNFKKLFSSFDRIELDDHFMKVQVTTEFNKFGLTKAARPDAVLKYFLPAHQKSLIETTELTPAHFGNFTSFASAILEFDVSAQDYLIIFEGDAYIYNVPEFAKAVLEVMDYCSESEIGYVSFGGKHHLEEGYLVVQNERPTPLPYLVQAEHIPFCQCVMIRFDVVAALQRDLHKDWDVIDLYFMSWLKRNKVKAAVTNEAMVGQLDGYSLLDSRFKKYWKK